MALTPPDGSETSLFETLASGVGLLLFKTCSLAFPSSVHSYPSVLLSTLKNQEFTSEELKVPSTIPNGTGNIVQLVEYLARHEPLCLIPCTA